MTELLATRGLSDQQIHVVIQDLIPTSNTLSRLLKKFQMQGRREEENRSVLGVSWRYEVFPGDCGRT
jgi:hypothetical protein